MYKIKLGHTHDIAAEDIDTVIIEDIAPAAVPVENSVESPLSVVDDYDVEIIDFPLEYESESSLKS